MLTDEPLSIKSWSSKETGVRMLALRRGGRHGRHFLLSDTEGYTLADLIVSELEQHEKETH